jgi:uncharacterized membrane protein YciS (DUF1049 family)
MWVFRSFLILVVIAIVIGFAYFNNGPDQTVNINLFWTQRVDVPVITVVFWSFILGALVSWLLFISIYLKQSNQLSRANKTIQGLQSEVTSLRNRPIEETKDFLERRNGPQES